MWMNGWGSTAALAATIAAYLAVSTGAQTQADAKAAAVMSEVRKALGGEQKLGALKTLSLRADYRRDMTAGPMGGGGAMVVMMTGPGGAPAHGSQQATGKIEIDVDLPDKYLKSDVGLSGFSMTRTEGFDSGRPFLEVVGNSPGMRVQAEPPAADPVRAKNALTRSNTELARLMLGLVGGTQPGFAVTYTYGGQAESPDGKADIVDVAGPNDFKVRLFVDVETHLPLMLSFVEPEPLRITRMMAPGGGTGARTSAGGGTTRVELTEEQRAEIEKQRAEAAATPPKMVEYRLFFSDYRKVDGVSLPHRIARGTGGKTTEEWEVTSYKVNPLLKSDRFKVGS
jgi:hypothetical protein